MLSNSTQYAIRAVLYLSRKMETHERVKVNTIAEELHMPKAFLSKILQVLSRNKLISSSRGRGGGFYLSDENISKTLMDIVVCMEGHDIFEKCILGLPNCSNDSPCHLHQHYSIFKLGIDKTFRDVSIADLILDDMEKHYKL